MSVEEDCPICNSSQSAKERFATAKVAEHIKETPHSDGTHQEWIDRHTASGTLSEIRNALEDRSRPDS